MVWAVGCGGCTGGGGQMCWMQRGKRDEPCKKAVGCRQSETANAS